MIKKMLIVSILAILFISFQSENISAQCAMCKATVESSLKAGNTSAAGLNIGILYLLLMPYSLIAGLGYWWYSNNKKKKSQEEISS